MSRGTALTPQLAYLARCLEALTSVVEDEAKLCKRYVDGEYGHHTRSRHSLESSLKTLDRSARLARKAIENVLLADAVEHEIAELHRTGRPETTVNYNGFQTRT